MCTRKVKVEVTEFVGKLVRLEAGHTIHDVCHSALLQQSLVPCKLQASHKESRIDLSAAVLECGQFLLLPRLHLSFQLVANFAGVKAADDSCARLALQNDERIVRDMYSSSAALL